MLYSRLAHTGTLMGITTQPAEQVLQEYPEMTALYEEVHNTFADQDQTIQMLAGMGKSEKFDKLIELLRSDQSKCHPCKDGICSLYSAYHLHACARHPGFHRYGRCVRNSFTSCSGRYTTTVAAMCNTRNHKTRHRASPPFRKFVKNYGCDSIKGNMSRLITS